MNTKLTFAFPSLFITSLCLSMAAFAAEGERHITLQEDVASAELIRLDFAAGDVEVTGISGNKLTAEVTASCQKDGRDDCHKLLKKLDWAKQTGKHFELGLSPSGITHYNNTSMKIKIGVPQDKKLEVNLSAGELRINGTSACLDAGVNAGELNINLKESQVASAALSAKVGDVKLKTANGQERQGERSMLVGATLDWTGSGSCHTKASVLTGEAKLELK